MKKVYENIVKVDVSNAMTSGTVLGWDGTKYVKAVVDKTDAFSGDGTTTQFNLSASPVVVGSVTVLVNGTTATNYTVDYEAGTITFDTAPASGASIEVSYKYYTAEPEGILQEDVVANQTPDTAKVLFEGVVYQDELPEQLPDDVVAKLRRVKIYVETREVI